LENTFMQVHRRRIFVLHPHRQRNVRSFRNKEPPC
jgi:hypothetical protein